MFERLRLDRKIRELQRQKSRSANEMVDALVEVVHDTGKMPDKEIRDNELERTYEFNRQIDEHIAILETDYWLEQAQRHLLPTPDDEAYIPSKLDRRFYYFDETTLASLRSAVRKEQKERWDEFRTWATLAIGFVGALIGLVAVLKK